MSSIAAKFSNDGAELGPDPQGLRRGRLHWVILWSYPSNSLRFAAQETLDGQPVLGSLAFSM